MCLMMRNFLIQQATFFLILYPELKNLYYMYMPDNMAFKFIKKNEKINIITSYQKYISFFRLLLLMVYTFSLNFKYYKYFKYISPEKKVIWWSWGMKFIIQ